MRAQKTPADGASPANVHRDIQQGARAGFMGAQKLTMRFCVAARPWLVPHGRGGSFSRRQKPFMKSYNSKPEYVGKRGKLATFWLRVDAPPPPQKGAHIYTFHKQLLF